MVISALEENKSWEEGEAEKRGADCPLETHFSWATSQEGCHWSKDLKEVRSNYVQSWYKSTINHNLYWYSSTQGAVCNCVEVCWLLQ